MLLALSCISHNALCPYAWPQGQSGQGKQWWINRTNLRNGGCTVKGIRWEQIQIQERA